jgi:hypothetical protein
VGLNQLTLSVNLIAQWARNNLSTHLKNQVHDEAPMQCNRMKW